MTCADLLWCVLALAGLTVGGGLAYWRVSQPPHLRKMVLLQLEGSDEALKGVLWAARGPWLVLRSARLLADKREPVLLDGELVIERAKVRFSQVLG